MYIKKCCPSKILKHPKKNNIFIIADKNGGI